MDKKLNVYAEADTDVYRVAARTVRKFRRKMHKQFGGMHGYDTQVYMHQASEEEKLFLCYELLKDGEAIGSLTWADPSQLDQIYSYSEAPNILKRYLDPVDFAAIRLGAITEVKLERWGYLPCHIQEDARDIFEAVWAYEEGWRPSDESRRPSNCVEFLFY